MGMASAASQAMGFRFLASSLSFMARCSVATAIRAQPIDRTTSDSSQKTLSPEWYREDGMIPSGQVTEESAPPKRGAVRIFGVPVRLHFTFVLLVIFIVALGARGGESAAFNA